MYSKDDLDKVLINSSDIDSYIKENKEFLTTPSLTELLNYYLIQSNLSRASIAKLTLINERYVYEIFEGKKKPSRDKILQICIAMKLDLESANELIAAAGFNALSARSTRDSIIIFSLVNKKNLIDCNELLLEQNQLIFK